MSQKWLVESGIPPWGHRATCKMMPRCWSLAKVLNLGCTWDHLGGFYNLDDQALLQTPLDQNLWGGIWPEGSCQSSKVITMCL